jgi:hypothetical protein
MKAGLEEKIKDFVRGQGVKVVGIAGPERLDGPPSLDPTYTMPGARSIISMALPMDTQAIYDFLGKRSPVPHNLDQIRMNQQMYRTAEFTAGYIRSLGYHAKAVPTNNDYRRNPDALATLPSFSHRFGAIAAGIAGHGWSGNVMTAEYGASIYLGTVVTDAVLTSDPLRYTPRHFIDNYCSTCRMCDKTCAAQMFRDDEEEYVLLNGALHPRGKRRDINLCNISCFGLHGLSPDKKWTTWSFRWIEPWIDKPVDSLTKAAIHLQLLLKGTLSGDSAPRYSLIRAIGNELIPEEVVNEYLDKHPENLDREERENAFFAFAEDLGVTGLRDDRILTCGQCALVCGPTLEETAKRYRLLVNAGLVVLGPNGDMVNVATFEEALLLYKRNLPKIGPWAMLRDAMASAYLFHKRYFGLEPRSIIGGIRYARRLKKAVSERIYGHKDAVTGIVDNRRVPIEKAY